MNIHKTLRGKTNIFTRTMGFINLLDHKVRHCIHVDRESPERGHPWARLEGEGLFYLVYETLKLMSVKGITQP